MTLMLRSWTISIPVLKGLYQAFPGLANRQIRFIAVTWLTDAPFFSIEIDVKGSWIAQKYLYVNYFQVEFGYVKVKYSQGKIFVMNFCQTLI